ncbi:hypothetical protein FRB93_013411 [Tulasnella sp. JGI-2019a]|nr:hypothetical protein FRB93_013411 [Tulasnella sp. JGI-2019a]
MLVQTSKELLEEFIDSGDFDKTLQALIAAFDGSRAKERLLRNIELIGQRSLQDDGEQQRSSDELHSDLSKELERSAMINKTLLDVSDELLDNKFMEKLSTSLFRIITTSQTASQAKAGSNGVTVAERSLANGLYVNDSHDSEMSNGIGQPAGRRMDLPSSSPPVEMENGLVNGTITL